MSQDVDLDRVSMRFGRLTAVDTVDLTIRGGEFFSFLGPSGCGKTTILRLISGFMEPTAGAIRIGGRDMRGIGPNRRPTALIFQNLALFPLMTVAENIGFGLEVRRVPAADRARRVRDLLELVDLPDAGRKKVTELSGGQRQRVAIARALAVEPAVLLLDEPLSALDLKLRQHMRSELRAIQRRTGLTFVYITHDQGEALTMSDRIGVMSKGVLEQVDDGPTIYNEPATAFVAGFVGENNRFAGRVAGNDEAGHAVIDTPVGRLTGRNPHGLRPGDEALLFVRPERLIPLDPAGAAGAATGNGFNRIAGRVGHRDFEGAFANLFVEAPDGTTLMLHLTNGGSGGFLAGADGRVPVPGSVLAVGFRGRDAVVLPPAGRREP